MAEGGRHGIKKQSSIEEGGRTVVNIRFGAALLGRIDADARRLGINRTAWLHVAADGMLDR